MTQLQNSYQGGDFRHGIKNFETWKNDQIRGTIVQFKSGSTNSNFGKGSETGKI